MSLRHPVRHPWKKVWAHAGDRWPRLDSILLWVLWVLGSFSKIT